MESKADGAFLHAQEVFDGLASSARRYGHKLISASASEGTIGLDHLFELLDLVEESEFIYILETNGLNIGADPLIADRLAKYKRVHVRVSIKGASEDEFHTLTGAHRDAYELSYQALEHLISRGISCNACLMASFSDPDGVKTVRKRLAAIALAFLVRLKSSGSSNFRRYEPV